MRKKLTFILCGILLFGGLVNAQEVIKTIKLKNVSEKRYELNQSVENEMDFHIRLSDFQLKEVLTPKGMFQEISVEGLFKTYREGEPALPEFGKLIEVPYGAKASVEVISFSKEVIQLNDHGIAQQIIPAQRSMTKSEDPKKVPFVINEKIYNDNQLFEKPLARVENTGIMRNVQLGRVVINPFAYNPVTNQVLVYNDIKVKVHFSDSRKSVSQNLNSPYFERIFNAKLENHSNSSKGLIVDGPITYVIVSDPMFKETLQPLVDWKIKKGFNVIEAYTDDSNVGKTTTSIKSYLKDLYENPAEGTMAPSFVLFVGDVAQIPAFNGTTNSHVTDLYYCEYTGDLLPEVYYGRFSANNVAELEPQVMKTLQVEQYTMPDPSYLDHVVLVAGDDSNWAPTHGNGLVNYANQYYINSENGITSHSYLYPEANSNAANIRSDVSNGVAIANYTAHCNENGWAKPSFVISNVSSMTNKDMYPLMIGNCCLSAKFNVTSFGETVLRAKDKGAVGYIGASNNSLWDEDFFWGVGLVSSVSANETYENSGTGVYDAFFHTKGEEISNWSITQSQIINAGNLQVEASSSANKAYYWEIYHLMGDPSLVPYVTVPEQNVVSCINNIVVSTTNLTVNAEANSYVALSTVVDGSRILLDAKRVDETGKVDLIFDQLTIPGDNILELVVTKQNRQPYVASLNVIAPEGAYVVSTGFEVSDASGNNNQLAEYDELINIDLNLKNIGIETANNVVVSLSTTDEYVSSLTENTAVGLNNIGVNETVVSSGKFKVQLANNIPDQHNVVFDITIDADNYDKTWTYKINLPVNAPELSVGRLTYNDDFEGNIVNGILEKGETAEIIIEFENNGHADLLNSTATIALKNASEYLTLVETEKNIALVTSNDLAEVKFKVEAGAEVPLEEIVPIGFSVEAGAYSVSEDRNVVIGQDTVFVMGEKQEIITMEGAFYDSGNSTGNYSNDENNTITFRPSLEGKYLQFRFTEFEVEDDYDFLSIYDGTSAAATLIGKYDGVLTTIGDTGVVTATNPEGALTFVFSSDNYLNEAGWRAEISVTDKIYKVTFNVINNAGKMSAAEINFDGETKSTNAQGVAVFNSGLIENANYVVQKDGYDNYSGNISVNENVEVNIHMVLTGIEDNLSEQVSIYPNPSNGIVNFDIPKGLNASQIFIHDISGRVVEQALISDQLERIDMSTKAKGIYIYQIHTDNEIIKGKLIIK